MRSVSSSAMKISIITVCYNAAATLGETLDSVAAQGYEDIEHIVVDGGSIDGTLQVLQAHGRRVSKWVSEPDRGIYDAMNKGISMATGDVVGILNADDVYADATVIEQVAKVFSDVEIDACYADLVYVDQNDPSRIIRYWKSCIFKDGLFRKGWMPAHPTFFVRRSIYEKFGGFDLEFPRQADFELTMRFMAVRKIATVYVPKVWVRMRMGGVSNSSIRGILKGNIEAYRACLKNGIQVSLWFIPRKMISRIPQFFRRENSPLR
jgi:glycosyltransferase involved in cell wall biosynthesis